MTNSGMPPLVKFLFLLTVFISTVSAFQFHVRSTPTGSSVMQRLPLPQNKITSILFAADDASENGAPSGEGSGEGATTTTPSTYGALSEESTVKVVKKCPDCDLCDGSGRILGGIGTVFEWWPIKAYRPCPNLIERGGRYDRAGQGLDEIAFGRDSTFQAGE